MIEIIVLRGSGEERVHYRVWLCYRMAVWVLNRVSNPGAGM